MRRKISDEVGTEPAAAFTPPRPSKAKRNREWEQRQRDELGFVGYRGIPKELNEELKAIAKELRVITGDVARAFIEFGLEAYRRGELKLESKPRDDKFTLYPRK